MANLGSIGYGQNEVYSIPQISFFARNISLNPITAYSRSPEDQYAQNYYRDQWKHVTGTVKNASGVGISRKVLLIDSRTGALRASGRSNNSGAFTIYIPFSIEAVLAVAVPDSGDVRNVVAFNAVLPV